MKDKLKISIENSAGLYYTATLQANNTYNITTGASVAYLDHLPIGWDKISLRWERNMTYWGVFRAKSEAIRFVMDGRAILLSQIFGNGGVNAYALVKVWELNETTFDYDLAFSAEADFSGCRDDKQTMIFNCPLLESRAVELLKSKSQSSFNIPYFVYVPDDEEWQPNGEIGSIYHDGIKVYWEANFQGAETAAAPFVYNVRGWNGGQRGTGSAEGMHTLPGLANKILVRNNGTKTEIGNDILEPTLRSSAQNPAYNEVNFKDNGNRFISYVVPIQPLTTEVAGDYKFRLQVDFATDIIFTTASPLNFVLRFVLFELNPNGEPSDAMPGFYDVFHILHTVSLGSTSPYTPSNFDITDTVGLNHPKAYVLGIIFDGETTTQDSSGSALFGLSKIELNIKSLSNGGATAPEFAPMLNPSKALFMPPALVWEKLIKSIDSTSTNSFGFPEIVGAFTGVSDVLSTHVDPDDNYGLNPVRLAYTSENAIRNINGIQYLTASISDFFDHWHNMNGCGLGIEGNNFIIEKMAHFFDASTEILPLGDIVQGLEIETMSGQMFSNLKCGWKEPQTNKDYSVDEFLTPTEYSLPLDKTPKTEDMAIGSPVVGIYEIEKMRAQINSGEFSSPSASNSTVLIQLSEEEPGTVVVQDPAGADHTLDEYYLDKFPDAQATDPAATSAPYVSGLRYPDTGYNYGLISPLNLKRNGPLLSSLLDQQETGNLAYRRQFQMNYNNPINPLEKPGLTINLLYPGGGHVAGATAADIPISDLDDKLFRPYIFKVTAKYPRSMYQLINANPYGYISFVWKGSLYKMFISSVRQIIGNGEPTVFEGIAHPDTTDEQLEV